MAFTFSLNPCKTSPAGESERQSTIVLHWIANALLPTQMRANGVGGPSDYIASSLLS